MKLSIIIPVYNEEQTVGQVISKISKLELGKITKEIIVVDDASTDKSKSIINEQKKLNPNTLKVYISIINLGKGAAVRFGLKYATGDIIIIQDADLELNPAEYPKLISPIIENQADVVYGSRFKGFKNENIPLRTILANKFLVILTNILFKGHLTDMETAYKVFKSSIIKDVNLRCVEFDFEAEVTAKILKGGYKIVEIPIEYKPRTPKEGKKMTWRHGIEAIYTLFKYRFFD
ncbi:glycosyltransferase family 2 protein [Candidatus Daviesbacteria bacterium]|nr:glycosyltransferase family 2 protein [Candidatus Daviesbacteria bacterium]